VTFTTIGVLFAVAAAMLEGFAQLFLKKSVLAGRRRGYWIGLGVALFVLESIVYTGALRHLDVSTAFPLSSLSFVVVTLLSQWMLRERVTAMRWLGVGLILSGTVLLVADA
jgi:drug/metabolite transporter (DMT)-like permease